MITCNASRCNDAAVASWLAKVLFGAMLEKIRPRELDLDHLAYGRYI